uniref:Peptidase S1 domain-containing protein n=1 Tax=Glossina pallidipes TaxID=7398 RepID=A0A1B0AHM4_GLOPL
MSSFLKKILFINFIFILFTVNDSETIDYADDYATGNATSYEDATIDYDTKFYYKRDNSNGAILENVFDSEGDYVFLTSYDQTKNSKDLYKYAVSIRLDHTHHCVGCIIRADLVLTAAHCFRSKRGDFSDLHIAVDVVAGQKRRLWETSSTQIRKAKRAILNECWNSEHDYCDIALVQLDKEFNLNDDSVAPLNLPKRPIVPHTLCSTCGWGRFYRNGPQVDEILYTDYLIASCKHNSGIICANPINTKNIQIELCDSGAPLICDVRVDVGGYSFYQEEYLKIRNFGKRLLILTTRIPIGRLTAEGLE